MFLIQYSLVDLLVLAASAALCYNSFNEQGHLEEQALLRL
jgi:hypothetical protein